MRSLLDRFRLDGRVAIVTGASSGLGVAFAAALAEAGADVVMGARRADRLEATREIVEQHGRQAVAVQTDVTSPEECERLAEAACHAFGRVDVLVNSAGVVGGAPATREAPEDFRSIVEVNLLGSYWMAQAAARRMTAGSSIVNVSSVLGLHPCDLPMAGYVASKAGLLGLTRELASQLSRHKGIRVNALAPGVFPSEMTEGEVGERISEQLSAPSALGRTGRLEEVCAPLVFLASDASSYVTGTTLTVDGGWAYP